MNQKSYLVVGGDSLVGGGLVTALEERGHTVYATTRRADTVGSRRVLLDFENYDSFIPPDDVGCIFVVAAATNYERCEKDPMAHKINVELIPGFIEAQLKRNLFVLFVSTNSVFGGERPWPKEDDPHTPQIPYAKQKSDAEAILNDAVEKLSAQSRFSIVRLTKILDSETSPLPNWFASWRAGKSVEPFEDLIFAPMSVQFVGQALATLGEKRISGNLHLSGAENVSYVRFARELAEALNVSPSLIAPTSAIKKGVNIAFKPTYSGLGMERTTKLSGVVPQTLKSVISDLVAA